MAFGFPFPHCATRSYRSRDARGLAGSREAPKKRRTGRRFMVVAHRRLPEAVEVFGDSTQKARE